MKMKSKLIVIGLMVIASISLLACSSPSNEISHEISCDDFMQGNNLTWIVSGVKAGDTVKAIICSNPTTGFRWELAGINDQTVLKQDGDPEFVPPREQIPGAGGKEIWIFKALQKGTSLVSLEYSQPWEGGEKAEWTFDITVTVD